MDAELTAILGTAAAEAAGRLGEVFTGPDSKPYTGVFQAADAFAIAAAGLQMEAAGFPDRTVISMTAARGQFTQPPLAWRGKQLVRTAAPPAQTLLVASMTTDDPLFFGFILINFQPARQQS